MEFLYPQPLGGRFRPRTSVCEPVATDQLCELDLLRWSIAGGGEEEARQPAADGAFQVALGAPDLIEVELVVKAVAGRLPHCLTRRNRVGIGKSGGRAVVGQHQS